MASDSTVGDVDAALELARRLARGLDVRLTYHDLRHTFGEVLPAARMLANDLGIGEHDRALIDVAAAFHDLGHLETHVEHEDASIAMARDHLPALGFSPDDIERIAGMIRATRLPQRPQNVVERILADADLAVLAADDFLERNDDLHREVCAFGPWRPKATWWSEQQAFLLDHVDHTSAARARFRAGRVANAERLAERQRGFLEQEGVC